MSASAPPPPPFPPPPPGPWGAPAPVAPWQPWGPPADVGDRALATLWDALYLWPSWVLHALAVTTFVVAAVSLDPATGSDDTLPGVLFALGGLLLVVGLVVALVMHVRNYVLDQGRTGCTWGKRRVGIRTVDLRTGQAPGAGSCLGRWVLHAALNQLLYVDYLWSLVDPARQTLTDKVLTTVVVRQPPVGP